MRMLARRMSIGLLFELWSRCLNLRLVTQMGISWRQYYHVMFIVSYLECFMKYYFLCRTSKRIFLVKYYFGFGAHYVLVSFRNQMCGLSIG